MEVVMYSKLELVIWDRDILSAMWRLGGSPLSEVPL